MRRASRIAWDITKLHGSEKWTYYYFYAIIDIYSRYIVGWMVADRESSELARLLLEKTIRQQGADPSKLTVHSDRGSSMTSKPVAFLLADLGATKSHSRPHVSNDIRTSSRFTKPRSINPPCASRRRSSGERYRTDQVLTWLNRRTRSCGLVHETIVRLLSDRLPRIHDNNS